MKLSEVKHTEAFDGLPKLSKEEYTLLWHNGYWDGPLSGMLRYRDREYWFEMFAENENESSEEKWYRRYAVVALSDEQIAYEMEVHEEFRLHVGTHCDYVEDSRNGKVQPQEHHHLFYDKHLAYCQGAPFETCDVIAYFER